MKILPHKHEDLNLLLRTNVEKPGIVMQTPVISTQRMQRKVDTWRFCSRQSALICKPQAEQRL